MENTHWTNREDEILVDLARKSKKQSIASQKASVILKRSDKACYLRLYILRKRGTYDAICKRLDKRTQPQSIPVAPVEVFEVPQELTQPSSVQNKIEVDVKYMTISNGKLVIHL